MVCVDCGAPAKFPGGESIELDLLYRFWLTVAATSNGGYSSYTLYAMRVRARNGLMVFGTFIRELRFGASVRDDGSLDFARDDN